MRVACVGERNSNKLLVMKPEGKRGLDEDWWTVLTLMLEKWSVRI